MFRRGEIIYETVYVICVDMLICVYVQVANEIKVSASIARASLEANQNNPNSPSATVSDTSHVVLMFSRIHSDDPLLVQDSFPVI